jgi:hypothetical protein
VEQLSGDGSDDHDDSDDRDGDDRDGDDHHHDDAQDGVSNRNPSA